MSFLGVVLALFGFGPTEAQRKIPAVFAYLAMVPVGYWRAEIVGFLFRLAGEWGTYLLVPGTICTALVAHSVIRVVLFHDDLSWGGWFRALFLTWWKAEP